VSAYPSGYIEQLARPFRARRIGGEERAKAHHRWHRAEQEPRDPTGNGARAGGLGSAEDTQTTRR